MPVDSVRADAKAEAQPDDDGEETIVTVRRLYVSHFLSTWNSRLFEFGSVLFSASIYPDTLLPASVYALVRGFSAVCLAPSVGRYIDRENRLKVVRISIVAQRIAVAISCIGFLCLQRKDVLPILLTAFILAILVVSACIEKLCSIMNLISVERDWVVVICGEDHTSLQVLNSQLRRIDLFCKLGGPLAISLIDGFSTVVALYMVLGTNILSVFIEYYAIRRVYFMNPRLQQRQKSSSESFMSTSIESPSTQGFVSVVIRWIQSLWKPLSSYVHHHVFLASLSLSLLYFTVLSFGAQMATYLLFVKLTSTTVGLIRTVSVALEISATWIAPWAMRRIGSVRAGLWFINWQLTWVGVAAGTFWWGVTPRWAATGLVVGVVISRVGLWGFDLCVQLIIQEEVDAASRGSFSTVEASFQNFFELFSFASTIIFPRPSQFRYPVLMSAAATGIAGALYAGFVRRKRGHLVHVSRCFTSERRHEDEDGLELEDSPSGRLLGNMA